MRNFKRLLGLMGILFMVFMIISFDKVERVWPMWLGGKSQSYYGNINLWHINDDFSQKIPYETMLKKFEKSNFGIFLNVTYMTVEEAQANMNAGSFPDMVTYSRNLFDNPKERLEELERMENDFLDRGELNGRIVAYPLYYDTYTMIINEELVSETEEEVPTIIEPAYVVNTLTKLQYPKETVPLGFTRYGGALYMLDALGENQGDTEYKSVTMRDFEKGNVAVMICSSLELESYGGELPSYSQYQFSGFTDRCRYVSVLKTEDKNKLKYCKEIAELLMSEKYQRQISEYGFSTLLGHESLICEKDVKIARVFENVFSEEAVKNRLNSDKSGLLEEMRKISGG